jgi:predicted phage terminase large subunit-like protein
MNRPIQRADLERFNAALAEKRRRIAKAEHQTRGYRDEDGVWQGGLLSFVRYFWHVLEPGTPFVDGWIPEAIAEHLEAVTFGEITNLLINTVPGSMKSLMTNVFWPAWEWGAMDLAHLRYVTFSYSSSNTERDNQRFGDLISSPEYQAMYPHVAIRQNGMTMVSNRRHGWKWASSVSGSATGKRGNRAICDDLNNVKESESKAVMDETNRWFRESLSSRLNNIETDAKVVIAQRVGEGDVSGEILRLGLPYVHLCIKMEFDWETATNQETGEPYTNEIGWVDPRWRPNKEDCEGELAWHERFSEKAVQSLKVELGPFATASQLQQTPEARGGGLIKREWWMPAEVYMTNDGQKFPPFEYIVASLDGAYTEEEKNDPSALVILGVFQNEHGYNRAMLVHAWSKRLEFSGPRMDIEPGEHESIYRRRCMPYWGLIEWVADTCKRFKADKLLIEAKASGISAAQSLRNSHGREGWTIQLVEPKGDKYARGLAVQSSFSQEMIYAPDRDWATKVIDNCAIFPYGAHDDDYDAMMQGVKHLRDTGLIRSDEERRAQELDAVRHRGAPKKPMYPGFSRRSA